MAESLSFGKRYENDNPYFSEPVRFRFAEMYQIGELNCEAGYVVPQHEQTVLEITCIVSGKGTVVTNGKTYPVEENSVFINRIGQTHEIRADRGTTLHFCYLGFKFLHVPTVADPFLADAEQFCNSWNGDDAFKDKSLLVLFLQCFEELQLKRHGYVAMTGAFVEQIISQTFRSYLDHRSNRKYTDVRYGDAAYVAVRYVDLHYRDIEDIKVLADTLGYSYSYLAHTFKEKTGMTIGAYIIAKKMDEAKWLLRIGRLNVSQVAARFNYQSVQSFSNSFKKSVGISPAEFQALPAQEAQKYHSAL